MNVVEEVVLLDEEGRGIGTAPKRDVHHRQTPLHLAFSCYLLDEGGSLLLTQRALHKPTWPGVWTNSFCGHPGPGEDMFEAVRRRATQELGVTLSDLRLVLPVFRYTAEMPDGTRENEMCPVFVGRTGDTVVADPAEVADLSWVPWVEFAEDVAAGAVDVSPWCVEQVRELQRHAAEDGSFEAADTSLLPPAARR